MHSVGCTAHNTWHCRHESRKDQRCWRRVCRQEELGWYVQLNRFTMLPLQTVNVNQSAECFHVCGEQYQRTVQSFQGLRDSPSNHDVLHPPLHTKTRKQKHTPSKLPVFTYACPSNVSARESSGNSSSQRHTVTNLPLVEPTAKQTNKPRSSLGMDCWACFARDNASLSFPTRMHAFTNPVIRTNTGIKFFRNVSSEGTGILHSSE